jgi:hypothetical protein
MLDTIWSDLSRPVTSVIKVDTEGSEAEVLSGARDLLASQRPYVLAEARGEPDLTRLCDLMEGLGYETLQPKGFAAWNYLFSP